MPMIVWHSPCESRTPPNYSNLKVDCASQIIIIFKKAPIGAFFVSITLILAI